MKGFVDYISYFVNHKTKNKNIIYAIFFLSYISATGLLLWHILYTRKIILFSTRNNWEVNCFLIFMCSLFAIHIWIYVATKYEEYIKQLETYFADDKNSKNGVYIKIWNEAKEWMTFTSNRKCRLYSVFVKLVYTCAWLGLCVITVWCTYKQGWIPPSIYTYLAILMYIISMFLNYYSYYRSVIFTYFIRNISNKWNKIDFNYMKPSNTDGFRNLVHASSRVAIAFFCDSIMYILLLLGLVVSNQNIAYKENDYLIILVLCTLVPSLISFLVVFLLPKIFLNRLLRRWKREAASLLYEKYKNQIENKNVNNKKHKKKILEVQARLDMIYNDNFPIIKTELFVAIISCLVEVVAVVITIIIS